MKKTTNELQLKALNRIANALEKINRRGELAELAVFSTIDILCKKNLDPNYNQKTFYTDLSKALKKVAKHR